MNERCEHTWPEPIRRKVKTVEADLPQPVSPPMSPLPVQKAEAEEKERWYRSKREIHELRCEHSENKEQDDTLQHTAWNDMHAYFLTRAKRQGEVVRIRSLRREDASEADRLAGEWIRAGPTPDTTKEDWSSCDETYTPDSLLESSSEEDEWTPSESSSKSGDERHCNCNKCIARRRMEWAETRLENAHTAFRRSKITAHELRDVILANSRYAPQEQVEFMSDEATKAIKEERREAEAKTRALEAERAEKKRWAKRAAYEAAAERSKAAQEARLKAKAAEAAEAATQRLVKKLVSGAIAALPVWTEIQRATLDKKRSMAAVRALNAAAARRAAFFTKRTLETRVDMKREREQLVRDRARRAEKAAAASTRAAREAERQAKKKSKNRPPPPRRPPAPAPAPPVPAPPRVRVNFKGRARTIQAVWRGYAARQLARTIRAANAQIASTRIQAAARAKMARTAHAAMKAEKKKKKRSKQAQNDSNCRAQPLGPPQFFHEDPKATAIGLVECPICFFEMGNGGIHVLTACGHVACGECVHLLTTCHTCRTPVTGSVRVFC